VLDEPGQVFAELAARPRALVPVIMLIGVALGSAFGIPSSVLRSATERQLQAVEQQNPGRLPPVQKAQALERATGAVGRTVVFVASTVFALVSLVVVAGVLLFSFSGLGTEPLSFRDEFAIVAHAYVPQLLGGIATLVAVAIVGDPQFRFSPGLLLDSQSGGFLYRLANQFGLFGAWNGYLLARGNQVKTKAKALTTPLAIVGGLWAVVNLAAAGFQTAFSGFLGM
jgi:hypothetical protein